MTPDSLWALRIGIVLSFTGLLVVLYGISRRVQGDSELARDLGIAGVVLLVIGLAAIAAVDV
jgi:formate-dependent nitrite reductase membrane component NrfD